MPKHLYVNQIVTRCQGCVYFTRAVCFNPAYPSSELCEPDFKKCPLPDFTAEICYRCGQPGAERKINVNSYCADCYLHYQDLGS